MRIAKINFEWAEKEIEIKTQIHINIGMLRQCIKMVIKVQKIMRTRKRYCYKIWHGQEAMKQEWRKQTNDKLKITKEPTRRVKEKDNA